MSNSYTKCETKFGFLLLQRSCGSLSSGQCVYCGRYFCLRCGIQEENHYDVCKRHSCKLKYTDLTTHKKWIVKQQKLNDQGLCAGDECEFKSLHTCEQCHLAFCKKCLKFTKARVVTVRTTLQVEKLICLHCKARQKIWNAN
jgi:hypothetical protein